jgi:ribosomal protein S12 methylthiotransferase accessory factor
MKERTLKNWLSATSDEDEFVTVPFVSLKNKRLDYLPLKVIFALCGSNGMCAGNTREEALVQGLAELFERLSQRQLMFGRLTPPDVPDEYLRNCPGLYDLKREIEASGRYRVIVKDCSLGKGYPVLATIIIDTERGTFGIKFAAHPSFDIALERTFTEAFQGKNLDIFTSYNVIGGEASILHRDNVLNSMKTGQGVYPKEIFAEKPSYEFTPFRETGGMTNREMLDILASLFLDEGYDVLIRDYSYLGFDSYFIVIPGVSELYEVDRLRVKETYSLYNIGKKIDFSDRGYMERLVRYIEYKQYSLLENNINWIFSRPFTKPITGSPMDTDFLLLTLLFDLGRYAEAGYQAGRMIKIAAQYGNKEEEAYCGGVAQYIFLLSEYGAGRAEEAGYILETLLGAEIRKRVTETFVPGAAVEHVLPRFNCWDCLNCEAAEICGYPDANVIIKRLKDKNKAKNLSQAPLLKALIK